MDAYNKLLLDLYHAARALPADEFPAVLMALLSAAVEFDFGRVLCADISDGTVELHGSIMHNIPTDNALDWESIQQQDRVLPHVLAHPGVAVAFHSTTLFAAQAYTLMRDYVQRYEHRNGLAIMLPDADSGLVDNISLYRAHDHAHFGPRQQQLLQALMPHVQEALKISRQLAAPSPRPPAHGALLIEQTDGAVQHCSAAAHQLMTGEWSDWRPLRLPPALLAALRARVDGGYSGKRIMIRCQAQKTLLFLRVAARSALSSLSRRELQVVRLYAQGLGAKEVARSLGITPATARNTLQKIYLKLDVHDKAALAVMLYA